MTIIIDATQIETLSTKLTPVSIESISIETVHVKTDTKGLIDIQGADLNVLKLNPVGPINVQGATIEAIQAEPVKKMNVQAMNMEVIHNHSPNVQAVTILSVAIEVLRPVPGIKSRGPMLVVAN